MFRGIKSELRCSGPLILTVPVYALILIVTLIPILFVLLTTRYVGASIFYGLTQIYEWVAPLL